MASRRKKKPFPWAFVVLSATGIAGFSFSLYLGAAMADMSDHLGEDGKPWSIGAMYRKGRGIFTRLSVRQAGIEAQGASCTSGMEMPWPFFKASRAGGAGKSEWPRVGWAGDRPLKLVSQSSPTLPSHPFLCLARCTIINARLFSPTKRSPVAHDVAR